MWKKIWPSFGGGHGPLWPPLDPPLHEPRIEFQWFIRPPCYIDDVAAKDECDADMHEQVHLDGLNLDRAWLDEYKSPALYLGMARRITRQSGDRVYIREHRCVCIASQSIDAQQDWPPSDDLEQETKICLDVHSLVRLGKSDDALHCMAATD